MPARSRTRTRRRAKRAPAGLNIDVGGDRVVIDLPRDGNERPALEAIGAMLESMS
jgi:hypothetical protein